MELRRELEFYSKLSTPSDVEAFSQVLGRMALSKDRKYIPVMLSYLDDDTEHGDLMKEIIGMSESFGADDYVSTVVDMTGTLRDRAWDWLEIIHYRIFNSDELTTVYKDALAGHAEEAAVRGYLKEFLNGNPEKRERVECVLAD
ncbi:MULTISPECIES: Imm30 family immunity protein [unclassified Myxococcus]|uniref:Imm30 family immunity protein n=1 Tax=unclassified Myxococcus TaxID=2648731 RepID=UPI00157A3C8B|nr:MULTISPECIES: Imm30 family immunity protein [unclassified Myxococcus]NTX33815.1 hypothetical protein [Myxococcus sp. CA033]NTX49811.1 hypothetical protein [Myxococcus sp. CA039A]